MKINYIISTVVLCLLMACSTPQLEDDDMLYTGLRPIEYTNYDSEGKHFSETKAEVEASLATAPNGALFGSSYYRTPLQYGIWVWNAFSDKKDFFSKWAVKSFGKAPVLISNVNPQLRRNVGKSVLQNNGYFNGSVAYDIDLGKPKRTKNDTVLRPRTAKIKYYVDFGHLYKLDSISYSNYPEEIYKKINDGNSLLRSDDPFSVSKLDAERSRIYNLLRNKGYYYYQNNYTTYLADTLQVPGMVQLQLHCVDSLPEKALKKWVIGKTAIQIRRTSREVITDTLTHRFLSIRFGGGKTPLRPRIILADMKLRPGNLFSQSAYQESLNNLTSKGIFSTVDINFEPRLNADGTYMEVPDTIKELSGETRAGAGVLDMTINTVLDKPYDFTFQANVMGKTNKRVGPGLVASLSKRNAFRGGELLSMSIGANYEFQTGGDLSMGNSYDFSVSLSLQMPRLLFPTLFGNKRRHWYTTPSTNIIVSGEIIRRAGFFNRYVMSASMDYTMQPTANSIHQFTPLSLTFGKTTDQSEEYLKKISLSAYSMIASRNELIPKMRYKYIYSSPNTFKNPFYAEVAVSEAGNIFNLLGMLVHNKGWNDKDKEILGTAYSQFVKVETDVRKTWRLGPYNSLVAHAFIGYMYAYGNNYIGPFSEQFYIGGANDLRGFSMRSVGPGKMHVNDNNIAYTQHNGDLKAIVNLEYRHRLFGSLYGAVFIDAGNVFSMNKDRNDAFIKDFGTQYGDPGKFDIGIDSGIGLRYDLDYFVLRLDWGFALHTPYDNGSKGFFNIPAFKKAQCVTFAIGYPF